MNRRKLYRKRSYTRTHPLTVTSYLKVSVVLLLVPVLQQILYRPESVLEIIGSMSLSAMYALCVVCWAFANYNGLKYKPSDRRLYVKSGVLIKRHFWLDYDKIHVLTMKKKWWSYPCGAVYISIDTSAGSSRRPDLSFWISEKKLVHSFDDLRSDADSASTYRAGNLRMLLMSASWSNPGTGLLFISPFISRTGDILGETLQNMFYSTFNVRLMLIAIGIPPVAAALGDILVFGWAVAMLIQFCRYANFTSYSREGFLITERGLPNRTICVTRLRDATALSIDQTLTMAIFKLYSASVFSVDFGKEKGDKSMVIVAEKKDRLKNSLKNLLPISTDENQTVRPPLRTLKSYLLVPILVTAMTAVLLSFMTFFEITSDLFKIALGFALIPLGWWLIFRIMAHRRAMLAVNDEAVIACGYKKWTAKKYIIPYDKIQYIGIRQNIFQRRTGTCDVQIYLYFEKKLCHTVKHLPLRQASNLVALVNSRMR